MIAGIKTLPVNPALQFTMEISDNNLSFLYFLITKQGKKDFDEYLFQTNRFKKICSI